MTVKEYLLEKLAEAEDVKLARAFEDVVKCDECPIEHDCKSEYYCYRHALEKMNEVI